MLGDRLLPAGVGVDRLGVGSQLQGGEPQDLAVDLQGRLLGKSPEHTHEGDLVREAQPIVGAPPQGDLSSARRSASRKGEDRRLSARLDQGTDNIRVVIHAKDTDGNYLAVCRAPEAAENGLRLDALGNLISITVLRATPRELGGVDLDLAVEDPVHSSLDHLALSLKSRPDPGQDVRVDALITRTSIRNLLLQGAVRRDAMSTQHTP